jgi:hypothetical protein
MKCIKIARNIFQTWETKNLSTGFTSLTQSWKNNNPNYTYFLFDDDDRKNFIKNNFDENVYKAYCRIIPGAFRADLWRYCVLYIHGGVYVDIDTICFDSIDNFIDENIEFMTPIDLNNCPYYGKYNLSNGFIASIARHHILMDCIKRIVYNVENNIVPFSNLDFSGPGVLGQATNIFIGNNENESFVGKEGIHNEIKFLKFDYGTEYVKDNNNILFQNKNGNEMIMDIYNNEIKNISYTDWGKCKNPIKPLENIYLDETTLNVELQKNYSSILDYDAELFKVYNYDKKIRLGTPNDNGYVIGLLDIEYDCYISAGISDDDSFTIGFLDKYDIDINNCYAFDGTINDLPENIKNSIKFIKKNIGPVNNQSTSNLCDIFEKYKNIFLKMDIEGSEWEWINAINENHLININQIVIELHGITNNSWHQNFTFDSFNTTIKEKINCLKKLNNTHYLIHAHGNNSDKCSHNGIPNVIELTYVNKRHFVDTPKLNAIELPDKELDSPNEKNVCDIDLNFYPFVNKINPFLIDIEEKNIYDESDYIDIQNKLHNKNVNSLIESMYTEKNKFYELNDFKIRINQGIKQQLVNNEYKIPNKTLYKIGNCDDNKNCIVCCTAFKNGNNDSRFVSSNNIIKSLTEVGYNGHFYLFNGGFPNPTGKEMKYAGVPYCFKIFMMLEAYNLGFKNILWIDSGCYALNNPDNLFKKLENDCVLCKKIESNNNYNAMSFEKTIRLLNRLTKCDLHNANYIETIMFGLNMDSNLIKGFIREYYEMVDLGWPFFSVFPEEIVISAIFNKPVYRQLLYSNNYIGNKLYIHENKINEAEARNSGYYFHHKNYKNIKNELDYNSNKSIHPFSFYIPDECIVTEIPEKTRLLASIIPGDLSTYIFKNKEKEYNDMYKKSRFALTKKKGGWDCLRHYEILMNGCIPLFENLNNCPSYTMTTYPKHLNAQAYDLYNNWIENDEFINKYNELLNKYLEHTRNNCTVTQQTKYFLNKIKDGYKAKNILMITGHSGINYNREPLWIGLKRYSKQINGIAVEYEKNAYIYTDTKNTEHFTYTKRINSDEYINMSKEEIIEKINSQFWDLIIYGKVGPDEYCDFPFFDIVKQKYSKDKIAFVFGGDEIFNLKQDNKNNYHINMFGVAIYYQPYINYLNYYKHFGECFVRELDM